MAISEKELLEAGFSKNEVDNLQGVVSENGKNRTLSLR